MSNNRLNHLSLLSINCDLTKDLQCDDQIKEFAAQKCRKVHGMGTITSKETRRISFNNNFALSPALTVQNVTAEVDDGIGIGTLTAEDGGELLFKESKKSIISQEDDEMDYWTQRLEYLKKEHQIINKIIETEYKKTVDNNNKLYEASKVTPEKIKKIKPCFDWRTKIMKCYEDNPRQPLVCSAVVQAFTNCVAASRIEE